MKTGNRPVQASRRIHAVQPDPLARRGLGSLSPVEDALAELQARTRPVRPRSLPLRKATSLVLAEPIRSSAPMPPHAAALRDGWAVTAGDLVGASSYSPVPLAAHPAWVEAGQAMPAGTDAVLPPDAVAVRDGLSEIVAEAVPGEGVRRMGEDAPPGAILREAGERVRSSDIAVALAAEIEQVLVREARVCVLSLPGAAALDAASELVTRFAEAAGAAVERISPTSRDAKAMADTLRDERSDLILIVGGTGLGQQDHAAEAVTAAGSLIAHGIALRPGETSGFGVVGTTPVILVPGRLESALATTLALVLPCLDHLMNAAPRLPSLSGPLTRKVSSAIGMTEVVLLRRMREELVPVAAGDLTFAAITSADAWLAVPPDSEGFAAGETVAAFLL